MFIKFEWNFKIKVNCDYNYCAIKTRILIIEIIMNEIIQGGCEIYN